MSKKKTAIGVGVIPKPGQESLEIVKASKQGTPVEEVEGHSQYWENVICPCCGGVNLILADTKMVIRYECAYGDGHHTFVC